MKSFKNKKRLSAWVIFGLLILVDSMWFGLLIFNRLNFAALEDNASAAEFGLFVLYLVGLLTCIVLSGFELRLLDENRCRILNIEAKVDYFLRLATFILALIFAFCRLSVNLQIILLLIEFVILGIYEFIFTVIFKHNSVFILDWLNSYLIIKSDKRNS